MINETLIQNSLPSIGTELINKLILLNSDMVDLENKIVKIHEIMSNSNPDDDLDQETLETLIFETKSKIKLYKDRYTVIENGLNEILKKSNGEIINIEYLKEKIQNEKDIFLKSYESTKEVVKRISSMAIKWEVGGSELVKKLIKDVKESQDTFSSSLLYFEESIGKLKEIIEKNIEQNIELTYEITKIKEKIKFMDENVVTIPILNKFKTDLSNFINNKQIETPRQIIKFD